jgi:hypothetical protein
MDEHLEEQEELLDMEEYLLMVRMKMRALKIKSEDASKRKEVSEENKTSKKDMQKLVSIMSKPGKFSTGFSQFRIFEKEIVPYLNVSEIEEEKWSVVIHTFLEKEPLSYRSLILFDS